MATWKKLEKNVNAEGTTITYKRLPEPGDPETAVLVQSRLRHVPHANREGTWDHTTYVVIINGVEIRERYSLKDAKDYAEEVLHGQPI